jgi:hypothetical protein
MVGDQRDERVADLRLARQLCFRHDGHADEVAVPSAVQLALAPRGELRPFHADVSAAVARGSRAKQGAP